MFSDSDDGDVVPLSQRLVTVPVKPTKTANHTLSVPPIVDIVECSSSPIPISSSPEIEEIQTTSQPIELTSSPLPDVVSNIGRPSPAPTPRATKKKKPNTPKVVPLSSKKSKKKIARNINENSQDSPSKGKPKVETKEEDGMKVNGSQVPGGKRPQAKISCRDCEARIDHSLIETHFSDEELRKAFAEFDVRFKYNTESVRPKTITWVREVKTRPASIEDDTPSGSIELKEENNVMVLLDAIDFAPMVQVFKMTNSVDDDIDVLSVASSGLSIEEVVSSSSESAESPVKRNPDPSFISFCSKMCITYPGKNVTILLVGLTAYYQKLKCKENKKYRDIIHGKDPSRRKSSMKHPRITREDVMEVLVDLDLNSHEVSKTQTVRVLFADRPEDVVTTIASFTKSIAEAPFKNMKNESRSMAWFAEGDKSSSVDVKSLEDVPRLWRKQLEQFPKVSQQVANAIASMHGTPLELYDTLTNIYDRYEAEALLKDIAIGMTGNRKVGPEASRKICSFITAINGDLFLNS